MDIINRILNSSNKRTQTAKRNIIGSICIKGVSIVVQLLLVPLTLGYLSDELYGVWITLSSIVIWMSFFDIGLTLGLKNRLAEALANNNIVFARKLVSTTYAAIFPLMTVIAILGYYTIPYVDWCNILNIDSKYTAEITKSIQIILVCVCMQLILNTLSSILQAEQKVALSGIFTPISNLLSLIVIFFLSLYTSPSLLTLVSSVAYIPIVVYLIGSVILFSGILKNIAPSIRYIRPRLIKNLFSLGFGFFFLNLQYILIFQTINFLISYMTSPIYVTQYSIANRYLSVAMMLFTIILNPFWPAFTEAYVKKDFLWMRNIYNKLIKIYLVATLGLLVLVIVSPLVYRIWLRSEVSIPVPMTISVAILLALNNWNSLQQNLLNGIGDIKLQVYISFFGLAAYFPLCFWLGGIYGAVGVIYAATIMSACQGLTFTCKLRRLIC